MAQNGRYGPYLTTARTPARCLTSPASSTAPLNRRWNCSPSPSADAGARSRSRAEIGTDPISGKRSNSKEGRFGPYVTDGETNAPAARGRRPVDDHLERASDLISERRAKGPAPKKPRKRAASPQVAGRVVNKLSPVCMARERVGAVKGLFVAFEGVDRSGKTTQLQLLAQRLSEKHECCSPVNLAGRRWLRPFACCCSPTMCRCPRAARHCCLLRRAPITSSARSDPRLNAALW